MNQEEVNNGDYLNSQLQIIADRLNISNMGEAGHFPRFFEIETFRGCNARCVYCPADEWKVKKMPNELFSQLAKEIGEHSDWVTWVCLSRNGEPLLDRDLENKIKELKDKGVKYVTFSTNASMLTEERARKLIESGLDEIRFSIDGVSKETFEGIRLRLKFEEVVGNIENFLKLRKEYEFRDDKGNLKPKVHIRAVMMDSNKHEEEEWNDYWTERVGEGDIVSSKPPHSWGNQLKTQGIFVPGQDYALTPCVSIYGTMIVHADGSVPLCGIDYDTKHLLGNVNEASIKEVWNSEEFKKIRDMHSNGKRNEIEECRDCNIWDTDVKEIYQI